MLLLLLGLCVLFSIPITYWCQEFAKVRKDHFMVIRRPKASIIFCIVALYHNLLERPLMILMYYNYITGPGVAVVENVMPGIPVMLGIAMFRCWTLFITTLKETLAKNEVLHLLNTPNRGSFVASVSTSRHSNYLTHVEFGDRWFSRQNCQICSRLVPQENMEMAVAMLTVIYLFSNFMMTILETSEFYFAVVNCLMLIVPCMVCCVWVNQSRQESPLLLYEEMQYCILYIVLLGGVFGVLMGVIYFAFGLTEETVFAVQTTFVMLGITGMCLIQTWWVTVKGRNYNSKKEPEATSKLRGCDQMLKTLEDRKEFIKFENHLTKEYCTENLKFFVEVCHLKQAVKQMLGHEVKFDAFQGLDFPWSREGLDYPEMLCRLHAGNIIARYIGHQSEHYVNISSRLQKRIREAYTESLNIPDEYWTNLLQVYDEGAQETFSLMLDSHRRFQMDGVLQTSSLVQVQPAAKN